jgi:hypothetical protein
MFKQLRFMDMDKLGEIEPQVTMNDEEKKWLSAFEEKLFGAPDMPERKQAVDSLQKSGYMRDIYKDPSSIDDVTKKTSEWLAGIEEAVFQLYADEIEKARDAFKPRFAVPRVILFQMGYHKEYAGTYLAVGYLAKAKLLMEAGICYQRADEEIGVYTDFCLRQAEALGVCSSMLKRAGIEDERTEWLSARAGNLINGYLQNAFGGRAEIICINPRVPKPITEWFDVTESESARLLFPIETE